MREIEDHTIIGGRLIPYFQQWIDLTENQLKNIGLKLYIRPNGLNRHLWNILTNSNRTNILIKHLWNIPEVHHILGHKVYPKKF